MDPSATTLWDLITEIGLVVAVSVLIGVLGRILYRAMVFPYSWGNPIQRLLLPGADEDRDMNEALARLLERFQPPPPVDVGLGQPPTLTSSPLNVEEMKLLGDLAQASAARGRARIMADAIFAAAIIVPSIFAFAPMAKAMLASIF